MFIEVNEYMRDECGPPHTLFALFSDRTDYVRLLDDMLNLHSKCLVAYVDMHG